MNGLCEISPEVLLQLQHLDTCLVSNAIETFDVRLRNEGFADGSVRCMISCGKSMAGYAVTGCLRTAAAPISAKWYYERMDWWEYVTTIPEPRVVVLQDVDHERGIGAMFGEIHAHICRALGCVGYVTNGAVRDVPALQALGFYVFATTTAVSHAYSHIIEFGEPVEIGGLRIKSGDLLHGDRHGVHSVPLSIAAGVPRVAQELRDKERKFIDFLRSPEFSLESFRARMEALR